ncbi:MAG TPA: hypothetical protein VHM91_15890, partial [Verrucomicrobiales bacterium]|nr:hypothetical protein [Verrucomicrobiales bacterium]
LAVMALRWPVEGQAAPPANPPVRYRHKQVAMPVQPPLVKTDLPFVPEYEAAFAGWEVVTATSLPPAPWPVNVEVPADRHWRPIPNQKLPWILYTLRQPVP